MTFTTQSAFASALQSIKSAIATDAITIVTIAFNAVMDEVDNFQDWSDAKFGTFRAHLLTAIGAVSTLVGYCFGVIFLAAKSLGQSAGEALTEEPTTTNDTFEDVEMAGYEELLGAAPVEFGYTQMTMPTLKGIAKEANLKGYSKLRKSELVAFLEVHVG